MFPFHILSYLKEVRKHLIASVPETDRAREYVERGTGAFFAIFINVLEKTGKATEGCSLPTPDTASKEYKSIVVPFLRAAINLDK